MNQDLSISFIKENCPTIASLKKRCEERRLLEGSQFAESGKARFGNRLNTNTPLNSKDTRITGSLMPSPNFTKLKQAKDNLETEQAFRELGVEML